MLWTSRDVEEGIDSFFFFYESKRRGRIFWLDIFRPVKLLEC